MARVMRVQGRGLLRRNTLLHLYSSRLSSKRSKIRSTPPPPPQMKPCNHNTYTHTRQANAQDTRETWDPYVDLCPYLSRVHMILRAYLPPPAPCFGLICPPPRLYMCVYIYIIFMCMCV
jgi:hypothetical protein